MATAYLNISMPRNDIRFARQMAKRMGWIMTEVPATDHLYDPESGQYLNEETMAAIREVESGKVTKCNSFDELLMAL